MMFRRIDRKKIALAMLALVKLAKLMVSYDPMADGLRVNTFQIRATASRNEQVGCGQ